MPAAETVSRLTRFERRGAGSDAERRAALWCCGELGSSRREATIETFWCRPNWALAHAWHSLLGLAGSLLVVSDSRLGGAIVLVALVSVAGDSLTGYSVGRRLTREHASQNVVSRAATTRDEAAPKIERAESVDDRIRLIVTSNYDAGRTGLVYRERPRIVAAAAKRMAGGGRLTPGWIGWLMIVLAWLLVVAILRSGGGDGGATAVPVAILQLIPTIVLVLELALLLELAGADFGPAAGDNASGAAVALALVRALDAAPPRRLGVELLLQGASDGEMIGLRKHLRARRRELTPAKTVVLGIAPCGQGRPCWWLSDGSLLPLRYLGRLRDLAAGVAGPGTDLDAFAHRGRGVSPALPARSAGLPALTIGCLDDRGLAPRSHQAGDLPEALDPGAMDTLLELALTLVDAIDADLLTAGAAVPQPAAPQR